ncbi:MAG: SDR family NAD(P)-dependent oxidoreductase [Hyphomicrobiaceae bacterium]
MAHQRNIIILGALSAIGEATARLYAKEGAKLVLAGRDSTRLEQVAADLAARGASGCLTVAIDLVQADAAATLAEMLGSLGGSVDAIFLFYGVLGDQKIAETDSGHASNILAVNFTSASAWCLAAADQLERQNRGVLVAVSSVAGDRGRQSNYVYGAAKAGLTALVEGIAHRLARGKARAAVVKLGFVDTPMTAHIPKGGPLWAKPDQVAARIKAVADKGSGPVVYIPSFWRPIMFIVRNVPAAIFHKTKL